MNNRPMIMSALNILAMALSVTHLSHHRDQGLTKLSKITRQLPCVFDVILYLVLLSILSYRSYYQTLNDPRISLLLIKV